MKLLETTKDGGAESTVWAHWLIEIKSLFSVALLRFEDGTRDAFHSHAFGCVSWVICGRLERRPHVGADVPRAVPDGQGGYAERTLTHGRKEVRA
jgi:hypothetical protein